MVSFIITRSFKFLADSLNKKINASLSFLSTPHVARKIERETTAWIPRPRNYASAFVDCGSRGKINDRSNYNTYEINDNLRSQS